jgi:hypothetical protein
MEAITTNIFRRRVRPQPVVLVITLSAQVDVCAMARKIGEALSRGSRT